MTDTPTTVLDHIDNIVVPGKVFAEPNNEYWALLCFWEGMEFLYGLSKKCDEAVKRSLNPDDKWRVVAMGNLSGLNQVPKNLLNCSYHWYSITACQYVRTIGAIASRQDTSRPKPLAYIESVIPDLKVFRDKVAAHLSFSTNNDKDNDAERLFSVLPAPAFENDCFNMGAFTVTLKNENGTQTSSAIKSWNLCKVHEELRKRYWPGDGSQDSPGSIDSPPQSEC